MKGDRLQCLGHGRLVAAHASGQGRPGRGTLAQHRAVAGQAAEQRVRRHQHRGGELVVDVGLRLGQHPVGRGQEPERLFELPVLQQPGHVRPADERYTAGLGARTPQRQRFPDHVLGRQLLGPAGVGRGQTLEPGGAALALEQDLEVLYRFLEA